ncbi:MAG: transcription elongation factor GreA [Candidatus Omnitrophica bacterium]|nr:transcription elongation factor GreA [Candidatus Omnitrophota bacterium]
MVEKILLTREGFEKLKKELERLKGAKRKEIGEDIARARAFGDLRENAEYETAKHNQALNEKRIVELEERLSLAEIVNDSKIPKDQVFIGATVLLKDLETNEEFLYAIVPHDEANFEEGKISVSSPIAKGLLGLKAGDEAEIRIPAGFLRYKVLNISR